ncbi:MAG: MerR family transcriptional regulator, partial [Flavobacteriaceae bacterium]|nr:MerR family transcriptional regulator [Flavobacteriaceae bacterium]MCY4253753.1 MerR family transcriptional regulator [Flavobacteriaceae bacterium]
MSVKLPNKLYYSIGEVAAAFNVSTSKLRYWETEFKEIRPKKKQNGIRKYTPNNIKALEQILYLREEKKLTINGTKMALSADSSDILKKELLEKLKSLRKDLIEFRD